MKLESIIEDIQGCIFSLQQRLDELKSMDDKSAETILLTRQEAADLIGKSLRQLDRDCYDTISGKCMPMAGSAFRKSTCSSIWDW